MTVGNFLTGETHVATVQGEFLRSFEMLWWFLPYIGGASVVVAVVTWALVHRLRDRDQKELLRWAKWMGWVPGVVLTFGTMGAGYPLITGIWIAWYFMVARHVYVGLGYRITEWIAATVLSAVHFLIA